MNNIHKHNEDISSNDDDLESSDNTEVRISDTGSVFNLTAEAAENVESSMKMGESAQSIYRELRDLSDFAKDNKFKNERGGAANFSKINWLQRYASRYSELGRDLDNKAGRYDIRSLSPFFANTPFGFIMSHKTKRGDLDMDGKGAEKREEQNHKKFLYALQGAIDMPETFKRCTEIIEALNRYDADTIRQSKISKREREWNGK